MPEEMSYRPKLLCVLSFTSPLPKESAHFKSLLVFPTSISCPVKCGHYLSTFQEFELGFSKESTGIRCSNAAEIPAFVRQKITVLNCNFSRHGC